MSYSCFFRGALSRRSAAKVALLLSVVLILGGCGGPDEAKESAAVTALQKAGALVVLGPDKRAFSANLSAIRQEEAVAGAVAALADLPDLPTLDVSRIAFTDEHAKVVGQLSELSSLMLNNTQITDAALPELGRLTNVTSLGLANNAITGAGLGSLGSLDELIVLDLSGTQITGGLAPLAKLPKLNWLKMRGVTITDDSLVSLGDSVSLGKLSVDAGTVSEETLAALRAKKQGLIIDIVSFGNPAGEAPASDDSDADSDAAE